MSANSYRRLTVGALSSRLLGMKKLYDSSFPKQERIPFGLIWLNLICRRAICFTYHIGNDIVAFSYLLNSTELSYLFFLAVAEKWQNQGIGTEIIRQLRQDAGDKPLIVTIEPLDEVADNLDQRQKRLAFYRTNGFQTTDYYYHEGTETYQILTTDPNSDYQQLLILIKTVLRGMIDVDINLEKKSHF